MKAKVKEFVFFDKEGEGEAFDAKTREKGCRLGIIVGKAIQRQAKKEDLTFLDEICGCLFNIGATLRYCSNMNKKVVGKRYPRKEVEDFLDECKKFILDHYFKKR